MRLCWVTDLHLNFLSRRERLAFAHSIRSTGAEAVVVTGDSAESGSLSFLLGSLQEDVGVPVYFVLGNHDFYGSSRAETLVRARAMDSERLVFLDDEKVVELDSRTWLLGQSGWYDGQHGYTEQPKILLSDWFQIADFSCASRDEFFARFSELKSSFRAVAVEEARLAGERLDSALRWCEHVVFATHYPPFPEACWHEGKRSGEDWIPWFTNKAMGDMLLSMAKKYPEDEITVLCGHTHSSGVFRHPESENLVVLTGVSSYGRPQISGVFETGKGGAEGGWG